MKKTYLILNIFYFLTLISCKKEKNETQNKISYSAIVNCEDCYWSLILKNKTYFQESRGKHQTNYSFEVNKGDTILLFGYTYDVNQPMEGTLKKDNIELKKGYAHCNQNPSFFMQYIAQ